MGAFKSTIGVDSTGVNSIIGVGMMPVFGVAVIKVGVTSSVGGMSVFVADACATAVNVASTGVSDAAARVKSNSALAVASKSGVFVGVGVNVGVLVGVFVAVLDGSGVTVAVSVGVNDGEGEGVWLANTIGVGDGTGVLVGDGVSVGVLLGVKVGVSVNVAVAVAVFVGV